MQNKILKIMPYIFVFLASLARPVDLDLGWHLKYGEYFWKTGKILRENIFSSEMQGYQYINHSWMTDIFTYAVFNKFGFFGLSVFSALVVVGIFYFFSRAFRLDIWEESFIFPFIFYISYGNIGMSFRSQLISLLFLGILYFLIKKFEDTKRNYILFLIPLLFLAWANMHGQFIIGLAVLGLWCAFRWKDIKSPAIGIVSVAVTLINPYGWRLYGEILRHFGNPLQKYVNEWKPISGDQFLFWAYIISGLLFLVGLITFYKKNQRKSEILYLVISAIIFWVFAFQQRRYFWTALFVAMPFFGAIVSAIKPLSKKIALYISGAIFIGLYIWVSFVKLPSEHIFTMDWNYYCRINGCSSASAEYLIKNKLTGKMLTDYNFGGWLIWNYQEIKPSIDGRMPFWRDGEQSSFAKYIALENNFSDIDNSDYDIVYISPNKKNIFDRLQKLAEEKKWTVAYHDLFSYVFVRAK